MEITTEVVRVTTAGADGSATGNAVSSTLRGLLLDIYLDYHASAPAATTDVTIAYTDKGGNLYAKADSVTDVLVAPRQKPVDNAAAAITNAFTNFPLNGTLTVTVAQSNALTDCLVAYIRYLALP